MEAYVKQQCEQRIAAMQDKVEARMAEFRARSALVREAMQPSSPSQA
ncbi:MAG: hypothetical protein Q8P67_16725 [archaeon]|nr:hypothetical protein [archaeon]